MYTVNSKQATGITLLPYLLFSISRQSVEASAVRAATPNVRENAIKLITTVHA